MDIEDLSLLTTAGLTKRMERAEEIATEFDRAGRLDRACWWWGRATAYRREIVRRSATTTTTSTQEG